MNWRDIDNPTKAADRDDPWSRYNRLARDPFGPRKFEMLGSHVARGHVVWRIRYISVKTAAKRNTYWWRYYANP